MAAWAPISNFLSLFLPSKSSTPTPTPTPTPKLPPTQVLSSPSLPSQIHLQTQETVDGFVPLVVQESQTHSKPLSAELASVMCPSLAFSNTLYFKSTYNVQVVVDDNEPEERLLNRFRREVMRAGVIQECKRRKFFENTQDEKKRKSREAAKRNRKRRPQLKTPYQKPVEASTSKKDDGEDNWDMPEETPYQSIQP